MAFGKMTKQDLIDAGLDPDKFASLVGTAVTKDDLTALKTELATSVTDLIKAQFTELETKLRPQTTTTTTTTNDDDPNKKKTPEELELERQNEFLTNPTGYVDKRVGNVVTGTVVELMKITRNMAYREGSKSLRGFKNAALKDEIDKEWAKYTPEVMARNGADPELLLTQIHDMILGKHHDEIIQDRDKKDGKYNLVHGGGGGNVGSITTTSSTVSGTTNNEMTEQEKVLAKKFGMTEDEWKKQSADMEKEQRDRTPGLVGA